MNGGIRKRLCVELDDEWGHKEAGNENDDAAGAATVRA
jgi:hypothetical protein